MLSLAERQQEIRARLQSGRLVLFVGSDADPALSGAPDRQTLAEGLASRLALRGGRPLAEIAQEAMQQGNRWFFTDYLRSQLILSPEVEPPPLYSALTRLVQRFPPQLLITTAWHNRWEDALKNAGVEVDAISQDDLLPFAKPERPMLLKPLGDIGQIDSLIVTQQDQNRLLRGSKHPGIMAEMRRGVWRNSLLFVAHNLYDPVTTALLDEAADGRFPSLSFALWPGLDKNAKDSWRTNRNLLVWEDDPVTFLRGLAE